MCQDFIVSFWPDKSLQQNTMCQPLLCSTQRKSNKGEKNKKMPEITVTKGIELIITLNNHNFLFNYSHSTQWKLSFPPDFSLTFWTLKNYNNKTTTYRLAGCVFSYLIPSTKCISLYSYLVFGIILIRKIETENILPLKKILL